MKKSKIGILMVCTGEKYWQYIRPLVGSARKHLLKGHDVEFMVWTDSEDDYGCTRFEAENVGFPYATLLRYHFFLQQGDYLKKFDHLFYCDVDMLFVDSVGDEILGDGLTATEHPGYAFPKAPLPEIFFMPFEPNPESSAYVPYPKLYFAGGFQGGKADDFIQAMRVMKANIDRDLNGNYIARWHDESHWNRYLVEHHPAVVLDPSYCYPDSLIETFYKKVWGRDYSPKLKCLTKTWTLTKEGADGASKIMDTIK